MDRLLWYVFAGSRGGPTRVRIVQAILDMPMNTNQLANGLGMDYKTIDYQLRVLQKHTYVVSRMEGYGRPWEPSKNLLAVLDEFEAIAAGGRPHRAAKASAGTSAGQSATSATDVGKRTNTTKEE